MSEFTASESETRTDAAGLTESEYHRLLATTRRRTILEALTERSPPLDIEDLARAVATRELEEATLETSFEDRVSLELHHVHLPLMAEVGVLEYDPSAGRIESWTVPDYGDG